jgi:hypothetical protein
VTGEQTTGGQFIITAHWTHNFVPGFSHAGIGSSGPVLIPRFTPVRLYISESSCLVCTYHSWYFIARIEPDPAVSMYVYKTLLFAHCNLQVSFGANEMTAPWMDCRGIFPGRSEPLAKTRGSESAFVQTRLGQESLDACFHSSF